jgi:ABC-type multidrug transport system fused ATPase/permease subunit
MAHSNIITNETNAEELSHFQLAKLIWQLLEKDRWPFLFFIIVMGLNQTVLYVELFLIGKVVDSIIANQLNNVFQLIAIYSTIGILSTIFYYYANIQTAKIQLNVVFRTREKLMKSLKKFDISWHQKANSGNKIQKIENGLRELGQLIKTFRRRIIQPISGIISLTFIFIFTDWRFLILVIVYCVLTYILQVYFGKKERLLIDLNNKQKEISTGKFYEIYNNVTTLKVTNTENNLQNKLHEDNLKIYNVDLKFREIYGYKSISQTSLAYIFNTVVLFTLTYSVLNSILTVGIFLIYFQYFIRLGTQVNTLIELDEQVKVQKLAIQRMLPILNEKPQIFFGEQFFPETFEEIKIKNLDFNYTDTLQSSLKIKNLTIKKGEKIGIVGRSGSGKSTLVKILMGLYQAKNGEILYNQTNFYNMDFEHIAANQSIVMQETELFNMSLKDNITLLNEVNPKILKKAITVSKLVEVIANLPKGIETIVGEKGYKLSGGQKQRVGIARAICANTPILIFDEATSALDSETESNIQKAIESELKEKTMIIIAHRLSTLRHVDKIIVFENGKIVETGKFGDLIADSKTKFAKLWQLQKQGVEL